MRSIVTVCPKPLCREQLRMLDLSEVGVIDGAFLGLCLVLLKQVTAAGGELTISGLNPDLVRIFRWNCVEYLL